MITTHARLNYLHDTLFGPIAKSVDCDMVLTSIAPSTYQVRVLHPVPDDLKKAHSLTILLSPTQHLIGTVAHVRN